MAISQAVFLDHLELSSLEPVRESITWGAWSVANAYKRLFLPTLKGL